MNEFQPIEDAPRGGEALCRFGFGDLSQADHRQEEQREPCAAADEAGVIRRDETGQRGDNQDRDGREPPGAIAGRASCRFHQDDDRRNEGEEEQDVI